MSNNLNQGASIEADIARVAEALEGSSPAAKIAFARIDAILRTPAATTGELPSMKEIDDIVYKCRQSGKDTTYDIVRAAIEADRAQQAGAAATSVKPWQERDSAYETPEFSQIERMEAEIADLRAQLAAKGQGEPVARVTRVFGAERAEIMGYEVGALSVNMPLYGAAPASAQPADDRQHMSHADMLALCAANPATASGLPLGAQPDQRESAAVPDGWKIERAPAPAKYIEVSAPDGTSHRVAGRGRNSEILLYGLCEAILAASPAAQPAKGAQAEGANQGDEGDRN